MKAASAATIANLATGQYLRADLYQFNLVNGTILRYTSADAPLVVSGNTYGTGLTITRGKTSQKVGLEVQTLDLEITPQGDNPSGAVTISGQPFVQAARAGVLSGARLLFSKMFMSSWSDTSPGAVPWFQGRVNNVAAGRHTVRVEIRSEIDRLNVAMPRNILQAGCIHTLYDAGCGLVKGAGATSAAGAVTGSPTASLFTSSISTATDGFYDLGTIEFLTGALAGVTRTVKTYLFSGGAQFALLQPLPSVPAVGDTFRAYAGCDKRQTTCSSKFANLARFRGYPYVPQPETLYTGGSGAPGPGGVDDPLIGSPWGGIQFPGTYQP